MDGPIRRPEWRRSICQRKRIRSRAAPHALMPSEPKKNPAVAPMAGELTKLAVQQHAASNDEQVVEDRGGRLVKELFSHQQCRAQNAAGKKKNLRGKKNPCHVRAQRDLSSRKRRLVHRTNGAAKNIITIVATVRTRTIRLSTSEEKALALVFVSAFAVAIQNGDEGYGNSSANEEIVHQVRKAERGHVRVGLGTSTEHPGDVFPARQAHQTGRNR